MKKYLYLLKNIGLLTISKFGSKILSFALVPIYTNILTTSEYGEFDLYYTTMYLLIPILTCQISESVLRFSLDKNENKSQVFSVGLVRFFKASILIIILALVNKYFNIITILNKYYILLILMTISEIFYSLISQFARGIDRIRAFAIAGIINSIVLFTSNILFLIYFRVGLNGYFISYILANIFPTVYLCFSLKIKKYIYFKKNKELTSKMYKYSMPFIPNNLAWWINNASDRYIVTYLCGTMANGIYSVSYKIPSLLNVFQEIFSQAWTLSAIKEFDEEHKTDFFSKIYKIYNIGMVITCSLLIVFDKILARILFANDFYIAWEYAPYLMISVVFGALSGMFGGIFSAAKKSKVFAKTTIVGGILNIFFNIILVNKYGPIGAAISTLISYVFVWITRYIETMKIIKLEIDITKDFVVYILLLLQAILLKLSVSIFQLFLIELVLFILIIAIYGKELSYALDTMKRKIKEGRKDEGLRIK